MKKPVLVFYNTLNIGGCRTLTMRMLQWSKKNGIECLVFNNSDDSELEKMICSLGARYIFLKRSDNKKIVDILTPLCLNHRIIVMSFDLGPWINMETLKKHKGMSFYNYLYVVIGVTFKKGSKIKNRIARQYCKSIFRNLLLKMAKNNSVFFLDENTIRETVDYLEIKNNDFQILRLPMIIENRNDAMSLISSGYNNRTIFTGARADFPFKGYIVGLIDNYVILKDKYPDCKLVIVSDGKDIGTVKEKISRIDDRISKDISLINWLSYEEFNKMIESSTVVVGMGTVVLDSALKYKPVIPVKYDTYDCVSESLFSENSVLCSDLDSTSLALPIIDKVLSFDYLDYLSVCKLSFRRVKELYNIDLFMDRIMNNEIDRNRCMLNAFQIMINKTYVKFRNL